MIMSYLTPHPRIRFESPDGDSPPVEASIQHDGRVRIQSDPDSLHMNAAWLTPAEVREFALELAGLADAAEAIYDYYEPG
jgi:hypothetical protein